MPQESDVRAPTFLQGSGEIGDLVLAIDWSTRSLGPLDNWPQSLRTAVSICLSSRFPIALYWGPEFVMLYNESLRPMVGANKHPQALGRPAFEVLPEIREIIEPLLLHVRNTGEATWSENLMLPLVRGDAPEESYFTFTYSPVRDESGGIGGVFCAVLETTDNVIEERRLRLLNSLAGAKRAATPAEACARAAEMLTEAGADVPMALVYLLDEAGAVATLAGTANAMRASAPEAILLGDPPGAAFEEATRTGAPVFVERASSPFTADHAAIVLPMERSGRGEPLGFVVVALSPMLRRSVSYERFHTLLAGSISQAVSTAASYAAERKRAESLAELDRAKTAFFSNVSHEFRTPLTLMLGQTEDALASPSRALAGEALESVHRNSQRILKLVNTLLDFSRIEAGRMNAVFRASDLSALTAGLASAFESVIVGAGMRLVIDCPVLPQAIWVDEDMWEKIVLNLVSNAFKFTLQGEIQVSLRWQGDRVELTVRDTGSGIPESDLPFVFDRFRRVEGGERRSYEGSGIGLALVQELVRLHGGSVSVESTPGQGTSFRVFIPAGDAHASSRELAPAARPHAREEATAGFVAETSPWTGLPPRSPEAPASDSLETPCTGRVLLADDNADMREYVRRTLEPFFVVEAVPDGAAAFDAALANPPDVVLSDVMMPRLDGFGLLKALRSDPRTAHLAVILLSARAGEEATVEGLAAGATDYLVKPFSARELRARVSGTVRAAQAKAERERLMAEVQAGRHRLENLIQNAPAFVCVLRGPTHIYEMVNPPCQRLLGVGRPLLGLSVAEALPELARQGYIELLDNVYRTGEPFLGNELPARFDRRGSGDLEDAFMNFVYQARRDQRGDVEGIDCFGFDVTDQVLARKRAESLTEALRLADNRKDEFLAMLAHELRNPMSAISLALSMLELDEGDAVKTARYRETARRQMGNLVRLVDDLLDVSRITRGKVDLRRERVDLAAIVQDASSSTRAALQARKHELSVLIDRGPFPVDADPTRLEQVVVNLLTNAAKYTEPGGRVAVRLSRSEAPGDSHAELRVTDTGRGVPKEMLESIFEIFVQVSPSLDRGSGGLGLGLTLVKRLVEMHGGRVWAESAGAAQGTELVVRLPLATTAGPAPAPTEQKRTGSDLPRGRRRVLLVEDAEDIRDTLRAYLERSGHEVAVAADGEEGLRKAIEWLPDVCLVDVGLPVIDGYELARRVRADDAGAKLFLVAITGYGGPEDKEKAAMAGFDVHLTKPVDARELSRVVGLEGRGPRG